MSPIDHDDLRRARRGDREALSRLLEEQKERLSHLAANRIGKDLRERIGVSDILQSTFMDILDGLDRFRGTTPDEFSAWATRVLENNIRDKHRFFGAAKRKANEPVLSDESAFRWPDDRTRTPSAQVATSEDLNRLRRALSTLPPSQRQVIELCHLQGRDYEEAAQEMGRTVHALRNLMCRARAALALQYDRLNTTAPQPTD